MMFLISMVCSSYLSPISQPPFGGRWGEAICSPNKTLTWKTKRPSAKKRSQLYDLCIWRGANRPPINYPQGEVPPPHPLPSPVWISIPSKEKLRENSEFLSFLMSFNRYYCR